MIRRGKNYGIGLASIRKSDKVSVDISVDGQMIPECEITVNTVTGGHSFTHGCFSI